LPELFNFLSFQEKIIDFSGKNIEFSGNVLLSLRSLSIVTSSFLENGERNALF